MSDAAVSHGIELHRLNMRFAKGYKPDYEASKVKSARQDELKHLMKDETKIRSKYKGIRDRSAAQGDDGAAQHKTSGIPIFGNDGAAASRLGWSRGHVKIRQKLLKMLRDKAQSPSERRGISAENSHALGHADFGTDHELSAPAASKAQNTEQLAIELGMRAAAQKLNADAALSDGTSLVHAKITDVLHPETGHLMARRFKLIRRANKDDHQGTVVFDHIMDGERLHISKQESEELSKRVHSVLTAPVPSPVTRSVEGVSPAKDAQKAVLGRKGAWDGGAEKAEISETALSRKQGDIYSALNRARGDNDQARLVSRMKGVPDRDGINMVGRDLTEVQFPAPQSAGAAPMQGQPALDELRKRVAASSGGKVTPQDFLISGSLPADDETKLHKAMVNFVEAGGDRLQKAAAQIDQAKSDDGSEYGPTAMINLEHRKHIADMIEPHREFEGPKGETGAQFWKRKDRTNAIALHASNAVTAYRSMEADNTGSGEAALKAHGYTLNTLLAGHAFDRQYYSSAEDDNNEAMLPPEEKDIDEHDSGGPGSALTSSQPAMMSGLASGGSVKLDDDDSMNVASSSQVISSSTGGAGGLLSLFQRAPTGVDPNLATQRSKRNHDDEDGEQLDSGKEQSRARLSSEVSVDADGSDGAAQFVWGQIPGSSPYAIAARDPQRTVSLPLLSQGGANQGGGSARNVPTSPVPPFNSAATAGLLRASLTAGSYQADDEEEAEEDDDAMDAAPK